MGCSLPGSCVYGIFQKEPWSGLLFLPVVALPNPGVPPAVPGSPAWAGRFLTSWITWEGPDLLISPQLWYTPGWTCVLKGSSVGERGESWVAYFYQWSWFEPCWETVFYLNMLKELENKQHLWKQNTPRLSWAESRIPALDRSPPLSQQDSGLRKAVRLFEVMTMRNSCLHLQPQSPHPAKPPCPLPPSAETSHRLDFSLRPTVTGLQ